MDPAPWELNVYSTDAQKDIVLAPILGYILTHHTLRAGFIPYCMFLFFIAALMRILYALFFEGNPSRGRPALRRVGLLQMLN